MSKRLGNSNRSGSRLSLRQGSASQLRLAQGPLAWLLLWKSLVRRGGDTSHLPDSAYRPRRVYSANTLTELPVGTVFIVHVPQGQWKKQADAMVWLVTAPGRSKLISHNAFSSEDNDFFEQWDITILSVVTELALVNKK